MRGRIEQIVRRVSFRQKFMEYFPEKYRARGASHCPFHDDRSPSFQLDDHHGYCHAGCVPSSMSGRFSVIDLHRKKYNTTLPGALEDLERMCGLAGDSGKGHMRKFVQSYPYRDEQGEVLYEKVRYEPKSFSWRRKTGPNEYNYSLGSVRRVLYNLPEIVASDAGELILFVEGEKDVEALRNLGYIATTSGSAQGWNYMVRSFGVHLPLSGRRVWVIADKDKPGRALAAQVAETLTGICSEVKALELPGDDVKDSSDLIEVFGKDAVFILDETGNKAPVYVTPSVTVRKTAASGDEKRSAERKSRFRLLDEMLAGWDFFFDQFGELWVSIQKGGHYQNIFVNSEKFRDHVRANYKSITGDGLSRDTIEQVIGAKRGALDHVLPVRRIEYRIIRDDADHSIIVDSGRDDWSVIRIRPDCYAIEHIQVNPFRRDPQCRPYDFDESPVSCVWEELFDVIPAREQNSRGLIKMWMALAMIPDISKPGMIINGPPGAGKSFSAQTIRQIVDPCANPLQGLPKDIENLKLALFKNHIPNFDNLNRLDTDQSDCLCQAVTGISYEKRKLHTDSDTVCWHLRRQWILTGVNVPGSMADFLSRSFIVELSPIEPHSRKDVRELESRLDSIKAGIQAKLFECASDGLRNYEEVKSSGLHRLADAHRYCLAMSGPLELSHDEINDLWALNRQAQVKETIDNDVVAQVILDFTIQERTWEGSPAELFQALTNFSDATNQPWRKFWPTTPGNLTKRINYIMESLRMNGVYISDLRTQMQRLKRLSYNPEPIQVDLLNRN